MINGPPQRALRFLLHLGFLLTGVGTVLLGAILPRVSAQWHLRDKDAGLLLFVQFAASASGALLTRKALWQTLACGYSLSASAAICIFLLQQNSYSLLVLLLFAFFGLGLGLAMTSTNLLITRMFADRRGSALALLNFSWSAGAVACPLLAGRVFAHAPAGTLFGLTGLLLVPFAATPLFAGPAVHQTEDPAQRRRTGPAEAPVIAYFALLAFLYVGVESTVSNWISTYSMRIAPWSVGGSSMVVAVYWATLMLGRGLTPLSLHWLTERRLYQWAALLVIGGVASLLSAHSATAIFTGAAISGLALAPLFPLTISLLLAEIGESQNAGWVFALAGAGGGAFSWLTGFVSTHAGSLRVGLLVPAAASVCMTALIALRAPGHLYQTAAEPEN